MQRDVCACLGIGRGQSALPPRARSCPTPSGNCSWSAPHHRSHVQAVDHLAHPAAGEPRRRHRSSSRLCSGALTRGCRARFRICAGPPRCDGAGRLVGMITVDYIVHIISEEGAITLLVMRDEATSRAGVRFSKSRCAWLIANCYSAGAASSPQLRGSIGAGCLRR